MKWYTSPVSTLFEMVLVMMMMHYDTSTAYYKCSDVIRQSRQD